MNLDRTLQREILEFLRNSYPAHVTNFGQQEFAKHPSFAMNIAYLEEHGLLSGVKITRMDAPAYLVKVKITAAGLDFLEDDGGLGAILQTVTVKFDAENVREILQDKVLHMQLPEPEKRGMLDKIRNLPADGLRSLALKLIEKAAENPTEILRILQALSL